MSTLEIPEMKDHALKNIFCSNNFSCCTINDQLLKPISDILTEEQIFLDETLCVYKNLIIPFQKKGFVISELNVYETLCRYHTELLSLNVLHVQSLWEYYNRTLELCDVAIIKNVNEFIRVYKFYFNTICDITVLSGFVQIAKLIDVLKVPSSFFKNKIKSKDANITNEAIIEFSLKHPLQHLSR
jgi:amyotrophic lateral sclerosis 2 protein